MLQDAAIRNYGKDRYIYLNILTSR